MAKRIKKAEWSEFVSEFSSRNQFRLVELSGNAIAKDLRETPLLYLLGLRYVKISGEEVVEAYVTKAHDSHIGFRAASVRSPKVITLAEVSNIEDAGLSASTAGKKKMVLTLCGGLMDEVRRDVTARIAYALFEKEGRNHGRHFEHWGEAERIIHDVDRMVNERLV